MLQSVPKYKRANKFGKFLVQAFTVSQNDLCDMGEIFPGKMSNKSVTAFPFVGIKCKHFHQVYKIGHNGNW